jgi:hypothetical protein
MKFERETHTLVCGVTDMQCRKVQCLVGKVWHTNLEWRFLFRKSIIMNPPRVYLKGWWSKHMWLFWTNGSQGLYICQRLFGFGIIQWNGIGTESMIFRSRKMLLPHIWHKDNIINTNLRHLWTGITLTLSMPGKLNWPEWTSTHRCTMQDGWRMDGKQFFQCIPIPQLTIHMHSSHYQCWEDTRLKNW